MTSSSQPPKVSSSFASSSQPASSSAKKTDPKTSSSADSRDKNPSEGDIALEEDDKINFGTIPLHVDFIKAIRACKELADHTQGKVPLMWRGYNTAILPNLPEFTVGALRERLKLALTGILHITDAEKKVKFISD